MRAASRFEQPCHHLHGGRHLHEPLREDLDHDSEQRMPDSGHHTDLSNAELNNARYILRCGTSNRDDIGKYAAMMTVDYLVMSYLKEYRKF